MSLANCGHSRRAFSLTELMVAMTIAMMVMAAVAGLFRVFGQGLSGSQATAELSGKLRAASWQLRKDLMGITCDVVPGIAPEADAGYFEYIEGPREDKSAAHGDATIGADTDDVLRFTARSLADLFTGTEENGTTVESRCAEVAWFCEPAEVQPLASGTVHTLYRRQRLVAAVPGVGSFSAGARVSGTSADPWSTHIVSGTRYANSLGDLTKPEHRFPPASLKNDRKGEDVVLTNVIAFDVRAYKPEDEDYIDLEAGTFDTWNSQSPTSPPYPVPLRGLEVRIRCYEPASKQIRQITVRHTFVDR